jgi:hypothetical protein
MSMLGILVGAAVALIVAYMHRKQMRQIEAYRQNPAVGLVPPPHRVIAFVQAHKYLIVGGGGGTIMVLLGSWQPGPITHISVLIIAVGAASIFSGFLFDLLNRVIGVIEKIVTVYDSDHK